MSESLSNPTEPGAVCSTCAGTGVVECGCARRDARGNPAPDCPSCQGSGVAPCGACQADVLPPAPLTPEELEFRSFLPENGEPDSAARIVGLLDALSKGTGGVNHRAKVELCALRPAAVVPFLVSGLRKGGVDLACCSAYVLGEIGPPARDAIPALVAARLRVPGHIGDEAATALRKIDPDGRETALVVGPSLEDAEPSIRYNALALLRNIETAFWPTGCLAQVERRIKDKERWIRRQGVEVLARCGPGPRGPEGMGALAAALEDPDPEIRDAVLTELDEAGAHIRPALPTLVRVMLRTGLDRWNYLRNREEAPRGRGPAAARPAGVPKALDVAVARLIGRAAPAVGVSAIREALSDPDPAVRFRAVRALGEMRDCWKAALPDLHARLSREEDAGIVCDLVRFLVEHRVSVLEAIPALARAVESWDACDGEEAAQCLADLGPQAIAAVPALIVGLGGPASASNLRRLCAHALGAFGEAALAAAPALIQHLEDPDVDVARAALRALEKIAPEVAKETVDRYLASPKWSVREWTARLAWNPWDPEDLDGPTSADIFEACLADAHPEVRFRILEELPKSLRTREPYATKLRDRRGDPEPRVREKIAELLEPGAA